MLDVFISQSLMATSKPGNRGLHRAGWLCPARLTADVTSKDFLFFLSPRLHVCNFNRQSTVCTLKEIAPKCYLYTSVTLKQHLLEPFFFFPNQKPFCEMKVVCGTDDRLWAGGQGSMQRIAGAERALQKILQMWSDMVLKAAGAGIAL